ncbi:COX15/CtaA family protein [Flavobacterium subsaxonicum]|uniref:Cytochrome oxidase assembly protein n=1 Tax=Flavobacterium subsaxonicum WB 4.1-42 = DSM 21790 TaxID=1121898 RepID=A0A0A2MN22_9FLAO|nr:COX15/CtaA family protein [Flavobacterium subsaxonicum]KGO92986.1 cytochrome oxidase assembly protein [Flavobacterium subsaxonicum WB 4.1-42 = DSM 21790]
MKRLFPKITKIALVLVYLVIVAGALVRMTGSGMGCPDWPRCFGYYIPPTDIKELMWAPNREFKSGQVIIKDEKLWVAKETFTTGTEYNATNWDEYTKHDYAEFNPVHTWVEYVNRLVGALAGLAVLAMAIASFGFKKTKSSIILLSWLAVFLMGFQAWLGATVVYSVLNPVKITIHMVAALVIVALILYILDKAKNLTHQQTIFKTDRFFKVLLWFSLLLTLIQVVLGTEVRQFVDERIKMLGYENLALVMDEPIINFYIHRSFSMVVLAVNIWLFIMNKQKGLGFAKTSWVLCLILVEVASGIAMYNFDFPFASQSIHVVTASILFGIQFYMILESRRNHVPTIQS